MGMDEEMEVQQPAKQHGRRGVRPSTCPSPDLMASSESSFLARTADFTQEEDNRTRAERMADHREQNALLQARNMHVRDFFLENMRSERDRETGQRSGRCGTNDCATAPSLYTCLLRMRE